MTMEDKKRVKAIGIDLGTTTTVVSYTGKKTGKLKQLKYNGEKIIPSVIYFKSASDWIIGESAAAMMALHPEAGVENFKSHLVDSDFRYDVIAENQEHFFLRPREAAKRFLQTVVQGMQDKLIKEFGGLDGTIDRAVITVPAKFAMRAKTATKRAARDCGLAVKITKEPTAAATDYLHRYSEFDKNGTAILVYDFGGGTFDVSVVQRHQDSFKEIATGGDNTLGGNLLTEHITRYLIGRIEEQYAVSFPEEEDADELEEEAYIAYQKNMAAVRRAANQMKEALSDESEVERDIWLTFDEQKKIFGAYLSRDSFEDMIRPDINRTVKIVQNTLDQAAEKGIDHIDTVVLVGGSSKVPLVRTAVQKRLPHLDIDPPSDADYLISRGATLLAERVENLDHIALITNTQIGTKAKEGMVFNKFQMLIPENTPLPASGSRSFILDHDGQEKIQIPYYEYDVDNHPGMTRTDQDGMEQVDVLTVELPPGLKKQDTEIEVLFTMQRDGSLEIEAVIKDTTGTVIRDRNLKLKHETDLE